jgi:hypothetical protein
MSKIVDFYVGSGTDHKLRSWEEIVSQSDDWLEFEHDFIQWLFPLKETSEFSKSAPILTDEDISVLKTELLFRGRMITSLFVMMSFFGLEPKIINNELKFEKDKFYFEERSKVWLSPNNHNYMRITRILKSLCLFGFNKYAETFMQYLLDLKKEFDSDISMTNIEYWMEAIEC